MNDTSRDALIVVDLQRGFDDHKHVPANHSLEETRSRPARSRARSPHRCTASSSTRTKHWTTECTLASRRLSPSRPHECHPPSPRFPDACKPRATDVRRAHVEVDLDFVVVDTRRVCDRPALIKRPAHDPPPCPSPPFTRGATPCPVRCTHTASAATSRSPMTARDRLDHESDPLEPMTAGSGSVGRCRP